MKRTRQEDPELEKLHTLRYHVKRFSSICEKGDEEYKEQVEKIITNINTAIAEKERQNAKIAELLSKAKTDMQAGYFIDASYSLDEAIELDPDYPGLRETKIAQLAGRAKATIDKYKNYYEATIYYKQAIDLGGNQDNNLKYDYYLSHAIAETQAYTCYFDDPKMQQQVLRKSIYWYKRILQEIDPADHEILLSSVKILCRIKNLSRAENNYAMQCLDRLPENLQVLSIKLKYYEQTNNHTSAQEVKEKITSLKQNSNNTENDKQPTPSSIKI